MEISGKLCRPEDQTFLSQPVGQLSRSALKRLLSKQFLQQHDKQAKLHLFRVARSVPAAIVKLQRFLLVFNVPPGCSKYSHIFLPFGTYQNQGAVRCTGQPVRAGQSVERILIRQFAQMVDRQQTNVVTVSDALERRRILVICAVGHPAACHASHLLQGVQNNQADARVFVQRPLQLLFQPLADGKSLPAKV